MKRLILSVACLFSAAAISFSQEVMFGLEARGGVLFDSNPHFYADNVSLVASGNFGEGFSFNWKQRLTRPLVGDQPLNGADQLKLNYSVGKWTFSAGKQVLEYGCLEYDAPPIDLHFTTEFYTNLTCYVLGVSASRKIGHFSLIGQVSRSPFASFDSPEMNSLLAFNLCLHSEYGRLWVPHYSLNMVELNPGNFSFQFSLGNRFEVTRWLALELDVINRSKPGEVNFFRDFSTVAYASVKPVEWMEIMLKGTYDRNDYWEDSAVPVGTKILKHGIGAYFFPTKDRKTVRFHCYLYNISKTTYFDVGITIKPTLINYSFKKK